MAHKIELEHTNHAGSIHRSDVGKLATTKSDYYNKSGAVLKKTVEKYSESIIAKVIKKE